MTLRLTRRTTLASAFALPLAAPALGGRSAAAQEAAPPVPAIAPYRRFTLGEATVTTLLAGTRPMDAPQGTFGLNVSAEDFAAVSAAAHIPSDMSVNFFTPTLVDLGGEVVLFDTGLAPEGITAALAAAGRRPEEVTLVVLTHMHGDHIGGLSDGGAPTFVNARYATGQIEFDHWAAAGNEGFEAKVRPLAEQMSLLADGAEATAGISAMLVPGHTPGHMAYRIESGGKALVLAADTANHYVWSLGQPDWEVRFDMDKAQAAASRRKLLDMLAADATPFVGYHMPFPGLGYVETAGSGFRFVPVSYQLDL